jgi:asparagine synthase (glutamine-hydrolysing)
MCGICGIFQFDRNNPINRKTLESMNSRILHRGPDSDGFYVSENVGLAMRRLSIIDVQHGDQPVANEDETVWLVYNGEIYNHAQLRTDLEKRGHRYRTHSDTETIVHLYEEYGRDLVKHLRGMFAFALWDTKKRKLLLARDRLGIKPLYYRRTQTELLFGSEIKTILAYPEVRAELNRDGIPEYLAFGYLAGNETFFAGINKLPAGHTAEIDESGNFSVEQYWDLNGVEADSGKPESFYVNTYRELLEDAISSHLMSDVPLGVFLSGGLDSSVVAALTKKIRGGDLQTFSVGYDEEGYSELPYAKIVAEHVGSQHHEIRVSQEDFFGALPKLIWHEDEPLMGPASVPLHFVAKLAQEHVKVVLSGEGADETLAGYARYPWTLLNSRAHGFYKLLPSGFRQLLRSEIADGGWLKADLRRKLQHSFIGRDGDRWESLYFDNFYSAFSEYEQGKLLSPSLRLNPGQAYKDSLKILESRNGDLLHRLLYTDIKSYLVELLMKQDQMSMAASVESRVPFLDHLLVEFTATIPSRYFTKKLSGKWILKNAVKDVLPESIIFRKKMGFPTPFNRWLSGAKLDDLESFLMEPRSLAREIFSEEGLRRLFAEQRSGQRSNFDCIWRLLNLELWQRIFLDGESETSFDFT